MYVGRPDAGGSEVQHGMAVATVRVQVEESAVSVSQCYGGPIALEIQASVVTQHG